MCCVSGADSGFRRQLTKIDGERTTDWQGDRWMLQFVSITVASAIACPLWNDYVIPYVGPAVGAYISLPGSVSRSLYTTASYAPPDVL